MASLGSPACLAERLLEGFVGFEDGSTEVRLHLPHNIYSPPTTGEIELPNGRIASVTVISENPTSVLEIDLSNTVRKISNVLAPNRNVVRSAK